MNWKSKPAPPGKRKSIHRRRHPHDTYCHRHNHRSRSLRAVAYVDACDGSNRSFVFRRVAFRCHQTPQYKEGLSFASYRPINTIAVNAVGRQPLLLSFQVFLSDTSSEIVNIDCERNSCRVVSVAQCLSHKNEAGSHRSRSKASSLDPEPEGVFFGRSM